MKAIQSLVVAAVAAAGMAVTADAQAASGHWGGGRVVSGGGHWSGGSHWGGSRWHGPRLGLYVGAPLLFAPWYGYYPYDYYYPRTTVIYRDVEPYPETYPEGYMAPPTTEVAPPAEGAPRQAPAYRNYCESAKAYFPKVTTCPEGWRFEPAR